MNMNVLITGGAGFIGSNVTRKLCELGHNVTVMDSLAPQIHGNEPEKTSPLYRSIAGKVRFVRGSVSEESAWLEALDGQDAIIHLAAETGTGQSMYEIKRYTDVNIGGTALMLDILVNRPNTIEKVVLASSRAIYGEGKYLSKVLGVVYPEARRESDLRQGRFNPICPQSGEEMTALPTDELSKIHPTSVYGITKQNQEQMVLTVCQAIGKVATALRYQNVYGPGQSLTNPYTGIISIFSTRILNGNTINIFEDGQESRDFLFIDDAVDATVAALFRDGVTSEAIGIGSGAPTSVITVARALLRFYQSDALTNVSGAYRLGDIRHNYADISKARELLGFEARVNFDDGIARFTHWARQQAVPNDGFDRSLNEMKTRGLLKS
jgi:dTDP-L-rhamnose 4-epimerase